MTASGELEPVIGLEVHAQLNTKSKMFCACSAAYAGARPNSHVCAVCLGVPGALPVINGPAFDMAVLTAMALNCEVAGESRFDRKNYHYPDLPKGYQISQYERPIGQAGWLEYQSDGDRRRCGIVRVHLEEDTGKLLHTIDNEVEVSLIDYNRSGVPLMEIVSQPDLRSPAEAREFFAGLRQVLMYLGVCDGNLQEGSLRADLNVSVRMPESELGTKVEIKNLNSFRAVERALAYEIARQIEVQLSGGRLEQETRGWDDGKEITVSQRTKEYAHDYRYFPEPDLPPMRVSEDSRKSIRELIPELPLARSARFQAEHGITAEAAGVLTAEKAHADYFEEAAALPGAVPRTVANWLINELLGRLRERKEPLVGGPVSSEALGKLAAMVDSGEVGGAAAKTILETMLDTREVPDDIADRLNLRRMGDDAELDRVVADVLADNPDAIIDFRRGKTRAADVLVGKVMAATGRRADARKVREIVERTLTED
jgi:aspartyl-tRNA(Asn)/glutamyl-tRNA(Gln) amidotransferase subunit B